MTTATQPTQLSDVLFYETDRNYCREEVTVLTGNNAVIGQVMGSVAKGAATSAAFAGNTGNGTMGAIVVGAAAKAGDYQLTITEPATDAGTFQVEDPDGIVIGTGTVGVEFVAGGLTFTLADGGTDFAAGDGFTITVAAGSGKLGNLDLTDATGLNVASAVMLSDTDATAADTKGVALVRDGIVKSGALVWPSGITTDQKNTALAQLKTAGIIARAEQ